jgi:hypothetical protein
MKPNSPGARGWDGGAGEAVGWAVDVAESNGADRLTIPLSVSCWQLRAGHVRKQVPGGEMLTRGSTSEGQAIGAD